MNARLNCLAGIAAAGVVVVVGLGCSADTRKVRHLERADGFYEKGDLEKARIEYLNALRIDMGQSRAVRRLGQIYYEQGNIAQAIPFLLEAEKREPNEIDVRLKLATIYLAADQFPRAREEAQAILKTEATNEEAVVILANAAGSTELARQTLQEIQQLESRIGATVGTQVALGNLYWRLEDAAATQGAYAKACRLDPNSCRAQVALGNYYWSEGDLEKAEAHFKSGSALAPLRSINRLKYADFKIKTGAVEEGRGLLKEIAQQAPDYAEALAYLAQIAYVEKNFEDCLSLSDQVLVRQPTNLDVLLLRTGVKLARGEVAEATQELERLSKRFPRSGKLQYQFALAHIANNDGSKALASLNQAVILAPNNTDAILLLARMNIDRGDATTAITSLGRVARQEKSELKKVQAQLLLAEAYRTRGSLEDALGIYRGLAQAYPTNGSLTFMVGLTLRQQNKTSEARQAFEKTLELIPKYVPAVGQLVDLDLAANNPDAALRQVQTQIAANPETAGLQSLLAKVYLVQTKTNLAEAALQKAIQLDDKFTAAYLSLAEIYVTANKHQEAIDRLKGILSKDPGNVPSLFLLGTIHEKLRDYTSAAQTYEKALQANPRFSPAMNNLAYLYAEYLDQKQKAYQLAQRARELLPLDPFAADTLGWILHQRGDYTWALSLLRESGEKLPGEPEVHYHIGMTHYMMGDEQAARVAFERALQLTRDFPRRDVVQQRMAVLNLNVEKADPKILEQLEKLLSENPKDVVVLLRVGALYDRAGQVEKAKAAYEKALAINPESVPVTVKLARLYYDRLKDPAKAMELARNARKMAPEDVDVAHALGRFAFQFATQPADFQWALSLLQEADRKRGDQPEILYDLAWAHYSLGQVAEAAQAMQRAVTAKPDFAQAADARRFLALMPWQRNPTPSQEVDTQVSEILKNEPDYPPALMVSGLAREKRASYEEARRLYERILGRYPVFLPAIKQLAVLCLDRLNDQNRAFELASKARAQISGDAELAKILGKIAYQRGEMPRAITLLGESARGLPSDAEIFYYLGLAHLKAKDKPAGRQALNQMLALNPDPKLAEEAKRVLAQLQ